MTDAELLTRSISEIGAMYRAGTLSPLELTRLCLQRIAALNPVLNAFITVTATQALEQASTAERELCSGLDRGPLHGEFGEGVFGDVIRRHHVQVEEGVLHRFLETFERTAVPRALGSSGESRSGRQRRIAKDCVRQPQVHAPFDANVSLEETGVPPGGIVPDPARVAPLECGNCRCKIHLGDHLRVTIESTVICEPLESDTPGQGKDGNEHHSIVRDTTDRGIRYRSSRHPPRP